MDAPNLAGLLTNFALAPGRRRYPKITYMLGLVPLQPLHRDRHVARSRGAVSELSLSLSIIVHCNRSWTSRLETGLNVGELELSLPASELLHPGAPKPRAERQRKLTPADGGGDCKRRRASAHSAGQSELTTVKAALEFSASSVAILTSCSVRLAAALLRSLTPPPRAANPPAAFAGLQVFQMFCGLLARALAE